MNVPSEATFRKVLGPNLQVGAMRAVLILAAFAAIGGILAWLVR